MSTRALAEAVRDLSPATVTKYDGQADSAASLPWLVLNQSVPDIDSRSEAGTQHGMVGRVLLTIAGANETAVLAVADLALPAFEGARVTVAGWNVSPLRRIGPVHIFPDTDVTMTGGKHPMVGKATFEYTVTRTA